MGWHPPPGWRKYTHAVDGHGAATPTATMAGETHDVEAIVVPHIYPDGFDVLTLKNDTERHYAVVSSEFDELCALARGGDRPVTAVHQANSVGQFGTIVKMWRDGDVGKALLRINRDSAVAGMLRNGLPLCVSLSQQTPQNGRARELHEVSFVMDPGRPGSVVCSLDGVPYTPRMPGSTYTRPATVPQAASTHFNMSDAQQTQQQQAPQEVSIESAIGALPEKHREMLLAHLKRQKAEVDGSRAAAERLIALEDENKRLKEEQEAKLKENDAAAFSLFTELLASQNLLDEENMKALREASSLQDLRTNRAAASAIQVASAAFSARKHTTVEVDRKRAIENVRSGNPELPAKRARSAQAASAGMADQASIEEGVSRAVAFYDQFADMAVDNPMSGWKG